MGNNKQNEVKGDNMKDIYDNDREVRRIERSLNGVKNSRPVVKAETSKPVNPLSVLLTEAVKRGDIAMIRKLQGKK